MNFNIVILLAACMFLTASASSYRRRPCKKNIRGPRKRSDSIAIVGAGAAGVHMAYLLKKRGFRDVTILEKRSRPGGKSQSIRYRGTTHEMGTCYLSPDYEENIIALMKKFTGNQLAHLPSASIWLDKFSMPITYKQYVGAQALRDFQTHNATEAQLKLVGAIMKYIQLHKKLFGSYEGELMPRPNVTVMHEIRGTFMEYLKRNNLASLHSLFLASHTMQGYGQLDEISALYGLMWNTPKLMIGLLKRIQGQKDTGLYMLRNGFQGLWQEMIYKANLNVVYDVDIRHVYRHRRGTWLCTKHEWECNFYKFVIWTPELKQSLRKFHPAHHDEIDAFSRTKVHYFSTSLINSRNVQKGSTPIDYMFSNVLFKREHSVWAQRDSYAALRNFKGSDYQSGVYPSANDGRDVRTTVGYQMGKTKPTKAQLQKIMERTLKTMNGRDIKIKLTIPWRYFPRYSPQEMNAGILWDIFAMQGKYGMWYSGSSVIFESVKSVVEYNKMLISKWKPTCG